MPRYHLTAASESSEAAVFLFVFAEDMRRQDGASPESGWAADRDTQRAAQRCVSALVQRHDGRRRVCDIGAAR